MSLWIVDAAKKQATKQLALAAAVLAIIAVVAVSNADYLRSYFKGAQSVSAADVTNGLVRSDAWIKLQADKLHPTGLQEITVRKKRGVERGREVSSEYFVAEIGDRLMLVKGVPGQGAELDGTMKPMEEKAYAQLFSDPAKAAALRPKFVTQMMDTHDFGASAGNWLPFGGFVALAALVWGGIGLARWRNPHAHPAVKPFVADGSLDAASNSIARDVGTRKFVSTGNVTLTRRFIVRQGWSSLDIKPATELLWAFKQVTQKKMYYVIPAGKAVAASLNFDKGTINLSAKEDKVDEVLAWVSEHAPWAVLGHSEEIAAIYKKQRDQLKSHVKEGIEKARAEAKARVVEEAAKAKVLQALAKEGASPNTERTAMPA